jgi:hypothetical protein
MSVGSHILLVEKLAYILELGAILGAHVNTGRSSVQHNSNINLWKK